MLYPDRREPSAMKDVVVDHPPRELRFWTVRASLFGRDAANVNASGSVSVVRQRRMAALPLL